MDNSPVPMITGGLFFYILFTTLFLFYSIQVLLSYIYEVYGATILFKPFQTKHWVFMY